ncbi:MAG: hypothetical protein ACE5JM_11605 [Armatimonadota bacterium]
MPKREKSDEEEREPWLMCDCIRDFLRSPVGRHLLNARKELLLAARACVDRKIERVERLLEDDEPRQVPVE